MKKLFLTLALAIATSGLFVSPAMASHKGKDHPPLYTITVNVNGLICDFCARAVEKILYKREGVEGVDVNLDTHIVKIDVAEGKTISDEDITKMITEAGYNVTKITR